VGQDVVRELLDLVAVHAFYRKIIEEAVGHEFPLPKEAAAPDSAAGKARHSVAVLERWLHVLDLAISPPMVRDALKQGTSIDVAQALLRYYVSQASPADAARDKADFVVTFLYRNPPAGAAWVASRAAGGELNWTPDAAQRFKQVLNTLLADLEPPPLAEEHRQLLREFEFLHQETEDFRHFDHITDSGIVQRVREFKQSFGRSFYNPEVLSHIAVYNVAFGKRFDELFKEATRQIKSFADRVQQEGASIMSRVDGDVMVKHLAEVEEDSILNQEYGRAQERFRKISQFKKAVDTRRGARAGGARMAASATPAVGAPATPAPATTPAAGAPAAANISLEAGKLRNLEETIMTFVRAAESKSAHIVPLRQGNLGLTPAEVEAYRADFRNEKSFRADYAAAMRQIVALIARMRGELQELDSKKHSAYLWKPHADSLTYMLAVADGLNAKVAQLLAMAEQRGLGDKSTAMTASLTKLQAEVQSVAGKLQGLGAQPQKGW